MIIQVILASFVMSSCDNIQQKSNDKIIEESVDVIEPDSVNALEAFRGHFSKSSAFAYAVVGGRKILLVSQETFGNNEKTDLEAVEASVFALDEECKIVSLGSIRSQGTLYPVSLLDGKLMVAGHQFVKVYDIRGDIPELVLDDYEEGESPKLTKMFKMFENGTSIKFER